MIVNSQYNTLQINREGYDPTHTLMLRNAFAKDMKHRFDELTKVIKQTIVDEDCFGLDKYKITTHQMQTRGQGAFAFPRSDVKLSQFMIWLQEQIDNGILEVKDLQQIGVSVESAWTNKYIFDSYKRGLIRARQELKRGGYRNIPSIDDTGGILVSMGLPLHLERLGLLYTRTFSELKGVTAVMDSQISRILAQGLADGDNPLLLSQKIVAVINGTGMGELGITDTLGRFIPAGRRGDMVARTEVIRAHHKSMIQEYRNWAVFGVIVKGEWKTAGDGRVCEACAEMEGHVYTLDEIENMIPAHTCCRCVALPYILEKGSKYKRVA